MQARPQHQLRCGWIRKNRFVAFSKIVWYNDNVVRLDKCQLTTEFAINKNEELNIFHVSKIQSYLLSCFAQANKSFINSIRRMYDECRPLFSQHSTSHTLDPSSLFLSLPPFCLLSGLKLTCSIPYKRLWFVQVLYHWIHAFQHVLFSFEGLPYNNWN